MKTIAASLLLAFLLSVVGLPTFAQVDSTAGRRPEEIFTICEQPPQFPGGNAALDEYIRQNLRYPEAARQAKREGRVFVQFIITYQGAIEDVTALNHRGKGMAEEAVRLVSNMPNWIPGKQAGKNVNVRYNLPVNFRL